jgi:YVTN family beta-propeller protein
VAGAASGQWVEDSIETGRYVRSLVYNYRAGRVLGISWDDDCLFSIVCERNEIHNATLVHSPLDLAYNATDNKVYCAHGEGGDSVLVAHGTDVRRLKEIPVDGAWSVLWDSVSNRVYVACGLENDVAVIDCATDSLVERIATGQCPVGLELNTLHRKLYVRNWDGESVSIIDLQTNQVIRTIRLGGVPQSGYYSTAVDKYYCGGASAEIVVIDGHDDTIVGHIPLPTGSYAKAMTGNETERLVMAGIYGAGTNRLYVVDGAADTVISILQVGDGPVSLKMSEVTGHLYCANTYSADVTIVTGDGTRVVATLGVGGQPLEVLVVPEYRRVYVGHLSSSYVYVIRDTASGICEVNRMVAKAAPTARVYPNPFRGSVALECTLPLGPKPGMKVHSLDGRLVRDLGTIAGNRRRCRSVWDGRDTRGRPAPPGVYILALDGPVACQTTVVKLE